MQDFGKVRLTMPDQVARRDLTDLPIEAATTGGKTIQQEDTLIDANANVSENGAVGDHHDEDDNDGLGVNEADDTGRKDNDKGVTDNVADHDDDVEAKDDDMSTFSDQDDNFEAPEASLMSPEDDTRYYRYEIVSWQIHVRQAEALWSADERLTSPKWHELMGEMEKSFLTDPIAFEAWKLIWVDSGREGWDPIIFAATYGLTSLAEMLFKLGAHSMDKTSLFDLTAFHLAAKSPNPFEMLQLCLRNGGGPNYQEENLPPFHYWQLVLGSDFGTEYVQAFIENGASCTLVNKHWGWNALFYIAAVGSDTKVLDLVLDAVDENWHRVDINSKSPDGGDTPLHCLLQRQDIPLELLKAFLSRGADVNFDDEHSQRPLYGAAFWGEIEAIEKFIGRVTEIDDDNTYGRTALHAAAWRGNDAVVERLVMAVTTEDIILVKRFIRLISD